MLTASPSLWLLPALFSSSFSAQLAASSSSRLQLIFSIPLLRLATTAEPSLQSAQPTFCSSSPAAHLWTVQPLIIFTVSTLVFHARSRLPYIHHCRARHRCYLPASCRRSILSSPSLPLPATFLRLLQFSSSSSSAVAAVGFLPRNVSATVAVYCFCRRFAAQFHPQFGRSSAQLRHLFHIPGSTAWPMQTLKTSIVSCVPSSSASLCCRLVLPSSSFSRQFQFSAHGTPSFSLLRLHRSRRPLVSPDQLSDSPASHRQPLPASFCQAHASFFRHRDASLSSSLLCFLHAVVSVATCFFVHLVAPAAAARPSLSLLCHCHRHHRLPQFQVSVHAVAHLTQPHQ